MTEQRKKDAVNTRTKYVRSQDCARVETPAGAVLVYHTQGPCRGERAGCPAYDVTAILVPGMVTVQRLSGAWAVHYHEGVAPTARNELCLLWHTSRSNAYLCVRQGQAPSCEKIDAIADAVRAAVEGEPK